MRVTLSSKRPTEIAEGLLVIAAGKNWQSEIGAALGRRIRSHRLESQLRNELQHHAFKGKDGDAVLLQTHGAVPARYVVVAGIGDGTGNQAWYKLAHTAVGRARDLKVARVAIVLSTEHLSPATIATLAEGVQLSSYTFDRMKGRPPRRQPKLEELLLLAPRRDAALRRALQLGQTTATATCYARDLINLPAAIVTPIYLATEAKRIARRQRLYVRVLDAAAMRRAGMGALLGVAQGSAQPPRFIELIYRPVVRPRRRVALAGKGITFDTGGLSLKPPQAMESQKRDMAGGAAVLAVMSVVRDLALPVEVRAYVPTTENMPSDRAIKPGDVVRAYNGKTIEVLNTDAEGRLVLADALSYAAAAKPDVLIDLATLTAAVRAALGNRYAAIMGTDAALVQELIAAGRACGENLWELPLVSEYRSDIDSSIADIKNTGEGSAGTIIGGLFLKEFVGSVPWAHIDFSSTVMADKTFPCHPRGATGFGVRTLLRYLQSL